MHKLLLFPILVSQILATTISTTSYENATHKPHEEPEGGMSRQMKEFLSKTHAICMIFAWFFFIIIAIGSARYFRDFKTDIMPMGVRIWFFIHRAFTVTGVVLMTIGFLAILIRHQFKWVAPKVHGGLLNSSSAAYHNMFGIFTIILAWCQALGSLVRCGPNAKWRPAFNFVHRTLGLIAWVFSAVTITIACKFFEGMFSNHDAAITLCTIFLCITVVLFLTSEGLSVYSGIMSKSNLADQENQTIRSNRSFQVWPLQSGLFVIYFVLTFAIVVTISALIGSS